jgi:hypothetical protein
MLSYATETYPLTDSAFFKDGEDHHQLRGLGSRAFTLSGLQRAGDQRAKGELIAPVYDELRQVAARFMRRERTGHTLSTTSVLHKAVIRLLNKAVFDKAAD